MAKAYARNDSPFVWISFSYDKKRYRKKTKYLIGDISKVQKEVIPLMMAKIKSGDILVIGGVMNEDTTNSDKGIPLLSNIPLLGYLFKSSIRTASVTETVIFIKATIVNIGGDVGEYDQDIHNKFNSSSRPFFKSK